MKKQTISSLKIEKDIELIPVFEEKHIYSVVHVAMNNLEQTVVAISGKPAVIYNNSIANDLFNNQKFIIGDDYGEVSTETFAMILNGIFENKIDIGANIDS